MSNFLWGIWNWIMGAKPEVQLRVGCYLLLIVVLLLLFILSIFDGSLAEAIGDSL